MSGTRGSASSLPSLARRVVRFETGEGRVLTWSFLYFFFLLCSYYVIRPLRDEMGISGGGDDRLTWLYMGTLLGTLAANPVLGLLVSRYPRRIFIPVVYHFLAGCLVVFYALLLGLSADARVHVARVFFVWASVFNLFAVSVFWGFMADLFRSEQGKRLFGFIGMGGTLGAVAGAWITSGLVRALGPVQLLLVAAAMLEAAVFCVRRLVRGPVSETPAERHARPDEPPGTGVLRGLRLVLTSPYLLGICLFLLLYSLTSTLLYFEQARIVRATFHDSVERTAFFARMDLSVNVLTVLIQALLTGRVLATIGIGATLAVLPALTMGGFLALSASATATMLVAVQVTRRAAEFALVRPAREVLFTVVRREEKYVSKNFIDTFVYRGGDAAGAWLDRGLAVLGMGAAGIALSFVPVSAAWILLALWLGRGQAIRTSRTRAEGDADR